MDQIAHLDDRAVVAVSGPDSPDFLQGLVTNDVTRIGEGSTGYTALLTPQGKILFDFLVKRRGEEFRLDCWIGHVEGLVKRLLLYRLRSKVLIERRDDLAVLAGWGDARSFAQSVIDPRIQALGWRAIVPRAEVPSRSLQASDYLKHRLDSAVPEGRDFGQDKIFALDAGLEGLHGVSFDKGCYVGQELTARMKHRGTARKGLILLMSSNGDPLGKEDSPVTSHSRELGTLMSVYGDRGFALLRLDRLSKAEHEEIDVVGCPVRIVRPPWLSA